MDDQAAERLLRVGHREQLAPATRLAQDALVADLAAALGIERGLVEDDLGLAVAGQLVELHPVPDDRDDPPLGGRRLVAEEAGVAGTTLDGAVQRGLLGVTRQLRPWFRSGCARAARRGRPRTPRARWRRRTRRRPRRSGRSESRRCRAAGTRCRRGAAARRREGRRDAARPPGRRGRRRPAWPISDSRSFVPASSVRPNCASSRAITPRISSRRRLDVRVRLTHDVDDDRGRLGHERLAPAEQPAVADRASEELAQDVAAALVRGQHVVGDQERDRARVVGDDLVAEALAFEGVGVVAQELAHPGMDRREQVGVVVGRDLLEDAGQALQPEPGIDARETAAAPDRRASGRTP